MHSLIGNFATSGKHLAGTGSHQSVSLLTKPKACLAFSAFEESQKAKKCPTLRRVYGQLADGPTRRHQLADA